MAEEPTPPGPSGRRIHRRAPEGFELVPDDAPPAPRPFVVHRSPTAPSDGGGGAAAGSCCLLVVLLAALAVCAACVSVGNRNHWTSDGPGMLFFMIGAAGGGLVAFLAGVSLLGGLLGSRLRDS